MVKDGRDRNICIFYLWYNVFMVKSKHSENAKAVALKVVAKVRKGTKVNLGKIILEQGYSPNVASHPKKITEQKVYKDIVNPVVEQMQRIRAKALDALEGKKFKREKVPVLLAVADVLTKNERLLGGKATENIGVIVDVSERIHNKYAQLSNQPANPSAAPAKTAINGSTEP